jgi:Glycosyl hydrolases family 25
VTIYFPDMSSFQAGINLTGALAAVVKATEGTSYANPYYSAQANEARRVGAFQPAYHFLHQGSAAVQAKWAHVHAGPVPLMVDAEPTTGLGGRIARKSMAMEVSRHTRELLTSAPTLSDICDFTDVYRALGGILWWVYLPRWYWKQMGSPSLKPLADRGLLLWSSDYTAYTDADSGAGWQLYDSYLTPQLWQYSASVGFGGLYDVDFSAFRGTFPGQEDPLSVAGCLAEFAALTLTGQLPGAPPQEVLPPVRDFHVAAVGDSTVRLQWDSPAGPSPFAVGWYQVTIRRHGQDLPSYPRPVVKGSNPESHQFGSLPLQQLEPGEKLTAWCRAIDTPAEDHASPWQTAQFPN